MAFERKILEAYDKISDSIIKADDVFETSKDSFDIRRQFHKDEIQLFCCECGQKLNVSSSKKDRLHFKHNPKSAPCLLKDEKLTAKESIDLYNIYRSKESDRHIELKNKIANKLSKIKGINTIHIDDRFIFDKNEKRKPDVYCKYFDRELVFEIQLSNLSLRYIYSRHEFYKRNKMFLIWILDNFDIQRQTQMEKDIKYLSDFHNFFKLDEECEDFKMICTYKYPFLNEYNNIYSKWRTESVGLEMIKFSTELYQIYYYDYGYRKKLKEEEQQKIQKKKLKEKIRYEANIVADELRDLWLEASDDFDGVDLSIRRLTDVELLMLNKIVFFEKKLSKPRIHHWVSIAKPTHYLFIGYMLNNHLFDFDINERSSEGYSIMKILSENSLFYTSTKFWLIKKILKRGYWFQKEDEYFIKKLNFNKQEIQSIIIHCYQANEVSNKELIDKIFEFSKLISIIESIKRNQIVGFGFKSTEWIALANYAISNYKEYWGYIELAYKQYEAWEELFALDRKGTFKRKLEAFYASGQEKKDDFDRLFKTLYPYLR